MIIKVIGVAIITLAACVVLKNTANSILPLIVFFAGTLILLLCFDEIGDILRFCYEICSNENYGDYFKVMLKGLGVAYVGEIGADLCRDCGEAQLGSKIEFAAKAEILVIAFPLIKKLIELSESILIL